MGLRSPLLSPSLIGPVGSVGSSKANPWLCLTVIKGSLEERRADWEGADPTGLCVPGLGSLLAHPDCEEPLTVSLQGDCSL